MSDKKFTPNQMEIVADLVQTYDTDPNDVTFFDNDAEPFLGYKTACVMLNRLMSDLADIDPEPLPPQFPDSVSVKVRLAFTDGRTRSGLGVANTNEKDEKGNPLTSQQILYTALSRGLRLAMRAAGISLIQMHRSGGIVTEFTGTSNRNSLLRQAHALGTEVGYISGTDKSAWRRFLQHRYGVTSSQHLGEDLLPDLIGTLSSIRQPIQKAAA